MPRFLAFHLRKELLERPLNDAPRRIRPILAAHHRVRLAGPRLPVGQQAPVESPQTVLDDPTPRRIIHIPLILLCPQHPVKPERQALPRRRPYVQRIGRVLTPTSSLLHAHPDRTLPIALGPHAHDDPNGRRIARRTRRRTRRRASVPRGDEPVCTPLTGRPAPPEQPHRADPRRRPFSLPSLLRRLGQPRGRKGREQGPLWVGRLGLVFIQIVGVALRPPRRRLLLARAQFTENIPQQRLVLLSPRTLPQAERGHDDEEIGSLVSRYRERLWRPTLLYSLPYYYARAVYVHVLFQYNGFDTAAGSCSKSSRSVRCRPGWSCFPL